MIQDTESSMSNLFQDTKTGKLVEFISKHDKDYAMVRDASGNVTYLTLDQLVPYEQGKGRLAKVKAPVLEIKEEEAPSPGCTTRRNTTEFEYSNS